MVFEQRLRDSGLVALDFLNNIDGETYGVNDDQESHVGGNSVEVPPSRVRQSPEQRELLQIQVDPLSSSGTFVSKSTKDPWSSFMSG